MDNEPPKNLIDSVKGFQHRVFIAGGMAWDKLQFSQRRMKNKIMIAMNSTRNLVLETRFWFSCLLWIHHFKQSILVLTYTVTEKVSDLNYLVTTPGRRNSRRLCHVKKPYLTRGNELSNDGFVPLALLVSPVPET